MKICLFDPGLDNNSGSPSSNLGDLIIQEAVKREIVSIFDNCEIIQISTHAFPTPEQIKLAHTCSLIFVGGTNLMESEMDHTKMWRISLRDKIKIGRAILFGVGWRKYQEAPNLYTKISIRSVLANNLLHSVRDSYTKMQLQKAGIKNVINTGCPTMWPLAHIRSDEIPQIKSENALTMLTDNSQKPDLDKKFLELLLSNYKKLVIWPQGKRDLPYIVKLILNMDVSSILLSNGSMHQIEHLINDESKFPVIILDHSITAFEKFVSSQISFDYIGSRLHGGVRCLIARKRSLVLEIDNRATEIARDTGLPTSERSNFSYISKWIHEPSVTKINIDLDSVNSWKSQFNKFVIEKQVANTLSPS